MGSEQGSARTKTAPAALVKATSPVAKHLAEPGFFVIGLPWGPKTNWAQNVLAAGGCTIRWKGVDYRATEPQLVDTQVALEAANRFQAAIIARIRFPAFMQLKR